jgi:hypothetical protein
MSEYTSLREVIIHMSQLLFMRPVLMQMEQVSASLESPIPISIMNAFT